MLVGRDVVYRMDLIHHVVDRVSAFDVQGDRLARHGLHEDLHVLK